MRNLISIAVSYFLAAMWLPGSSSASPTPLILPGGNGSCPYSLEAGIDQSSESLPEPTAPPEEHFIDPRQLEEENTFLRSLVQHQHELIQELNLKVEELETRINGKQ